MYLFLLIYCLNIPSNFTLHSDLHITIIHCTAFLIKVYNSSWKTAMPSDLLAYFH